MGVDTYLLSWRGIGGWAEGEGEGGGVDRV